MSDAAVGLRLTVIEDDADTRSNLRDILEMDSHSVQTYATTKEACASDSIVSSDVVIMDRKLPDGMAEDLLPRLKPRIAGADIIIITAYADMHAAIAAMREGVSDYLIKPIDPQALRASLARIATHRKVAEELVRQRRFAEKLLETAEAVVLVLDANGKILRANPFLLELTGYTVDEILDHDWFDTFIPEHDRSRIRSVFDETLKFNSRGIVNPILTKDGREREIRWSNKSWRDVDGHSAAVLCVGLDVTDYVEAQRKALQSERLAAIGQTMAGVAHESRNALQRLQNSVDLLQEELADQPALLADLAKVERAGRHIRDLLEEVREYAAPIQLSRRVESLPSVWRRAWDSLGLAATAPSAAVVENLDPEEPAELHSSNIDARRMEQVFRNLFENAKDAAAGELRVEIRCESFSDRLRILVRDYGPGVPDTQRHSLFDAFSTSKPTGTGLGLAICKRIVEAHDGTIRLLESETGAAFLIELPK